MYQQPLIMDSYNFVSPEGDYNVSDVNNRSATIFAINPDFIAQWYVLQIYSIYVII